MKKMKSRSCNSHIPSEIVVFEKILVRVPAKSLMRFKLVCKLWQSTILHDRHFHLSHRCLSPSRPSLLAFVGTYYPLSRYMPSSKIDTQDPLSIENRFVCASIPSSDSNSAHWEKTVREQDYYTTEVVNGLVCFYSKNSNNDLYLCNLSTRETMMLPPPSLPDSIKVYNRPCPHYLGFDDLNKVYKLLQIQRNQYFFDKKDNSKILTLRFNHNQNQDGWRNTSLRKSVGFRRSYCFRSSLYWIMDSYLIRFDLNKESYSTIQYPLNPAHHDTRVLAFREPTCSLWNDHGRRYYDSLEAGLTQVGGRLALTHSYVGATEFNIWLLDDNYEHMLYPAWDKITIHIPIHLRDPFALTAPLPIHLRDPFALTAPLPAKTIEISWSSFLTIPVGPLPGTMKIAFTIGRGMLYKPLVGIHMPVYTYDLESETWETLDNDYLPATVASSSSSSVGPAYKEYSQIYYLHEDNILPLKDILAPK